MGFDIWKDDKITKEMKKKVLIFLQNGIGGAERMSVLFGKSLSKDSYDVSFCVVRNTFSTRIVDFIPQDYSIIHIPKARPLKMIWRLFLTIWKEHPQIVFSSAMYLNTKILPFRYLYPSTRFIIRCENYLYTFNKKQRLFMRLSYNMADEIIAQTEEMKDELVNQIYINSQKIRVIHNPVDVELIEQLIKEGNNPYPIKGKKHFVAVGRYTYQKGFDLLIMAFGIFARTRDDVELYIVGDEKFGGGIFYRKVMDLVCQNGLDKLVHCVGYQKNPYLYIKYADCLVLSSRWEGMPNVLNEALYIGTPVAAFKCVPIVERMVKDGANGFLAEKESVTSLAKAMQNALSLGKIKTTCIQNQTIEI